MKAQTQIIKIEELLPSDTCLFLNTKYKVLSINFNKALPAYEVTFKATNDSQPYYYEAGQELTILSR